MNKKIVLMLLCTVAGFSARADLIMNSSTTNWVVVSYAGRVPDYYDDQQTGIPAADIVETNGLPALYYAFDGAGTSSTTDGQMGFRLRLGTGVAAGFNRVVHIGLDADTDGDIDLFVSVDNQGSTPYIRLFNPGTGLNTSPNTTTIDSQHPIVSYGEGSSNYSYLAVSLALDPTAFTLDADSDGSTDYFLSFCVPMSAVVNALASSGITFNQNSAFSLIAATSTQPNALNQDLNGPPKNFDGTKTWAQLGAASDAFLADGLAIPEPSSVVLISAGLILVGLLNPRALGRILDAARTVLRTHGLVP